MPKKFLKWTEYPNNYTGVGWNAQLGKVSANVCPDNPGAHVYRWTVEIDGVPYAGREEPFAKNLKSARKKCEKAVRKYRETVRKDAEALGFRVTEIETDDE